MNPSHDGASYLYIRNPIARDIDDKDAQDSLVKIARLVAPQSRVLDVGCSVGTLGAYLTQEKSCLVDGLDASAKALEIARPSYRDVRLVDLEQVSLADIFSAHSYDFVIFADVLEHLREPSKTLLQARGLLDTDGTILISIPNIAYVGINLELTRGNFQYREQGLLDTTHVQFFTERSMKQLTKALDLDCELADIVEIPLQDSEFRSFDFHSLKASELELYNASIDAGVYQFIFQAKMSLKSTRRKDSQKLLPRKPALRFKTAVYAGTEDLEFSESQIASAEVAMDGQFHNVHLDLARFKTMSFRFDPSDIEGSVLLRQLIVNDAAGNAIWHWDQRDPYLLKAQTFETQIMWPQTVIEPTRLDCLTRDSRIVLPVFPDKARLAQSIDITLAWQTVDKTTSDLGQDIEQLYSHLNHLEQEHVQLSREILELRSSHSWKITGPIRLASKLGKLYYREMRHVRQ